ncbi:MAG: shikimate dehydrogenase [Bacteroidales bacterium]|nr:shikimate dehydrogenase [Bacteroidales bacterium]
MKIYGLIGRKLGHSFSRRFFTEKFEQEGLRDCEYRNFEMDSIAEFPALVKSVRIAGLNCTIPYKEEVIPYLDGVIGAAAEIGAVNTVKFAATGRLVGYNTDVYGFEQSILPLLGTWNHGRRALILGTGGASKAVAYVLRKLDFELLFATTKSPAAGQINYADISGELVAETPLIVNTTPLGMFPDTERCPVLPYQAITVRHLLYDLIYNPEESLFLRRGHQCGATVKNGAEMLRLQALKSWEIWEQ